ncbi:MAG: hypothetical protein MUO82_08205 [Candidatus Thermoplasmatota archaeon]|nr:hypothetical protein [Candidatus Thermoplasmatota archaeon]
MRVISFKVSDEIYFALKSQNKTFKSIFEPLAIQLLVKGSKNKVYGSIQPDLDGLYKDIQAVKNICDKMLKSFKWDKRCDDNHSIPLSKKM